MKRKVAGCGRGDKMTDRITRRDALKLGTSAAVSATVSPLIRSITDHVSSVNRASSTLPDSESTVMPPTTEDEICFMRARDLAGTIRDKKISAREVMQAHLKQIARVNPKVNAIVTLVPEEQLMAQALAADEAIAKGHLLGPLHGLPVGVKDLHLTKGIRTTHGSPLHANDIPDADCLVVEREKNAGAIVIGKTNVPEWGLGSQTFNPVFGPTLNPYDLSKTCGGSTGGAAVALACGMVPLADGSDLGGSLRNPASFCNVVGLRPSLGRVPVWPSESVWIGLSVQGPMARTVEDVALFLSVITGPDPRAPQATAESGARFREPLHRDFRGVR